MTELNANRSPSHDEPPPAFQLAGDIPDCQIWKVNERAVLLSHVAGYQAAASKMKANYILRNVLDDIKKIWNKRYSRKNLKKDAAVQKEWDKKKKQIFTWFGNHATSKRGFKIPGFNVNVSFDSVVNVRKKDEIREEAKRLAGGVETTVKWLPHYQTAKKKVKEGLTARERNAYEEEVEEWKVNGIPSVVQGESASKHGQRIIEKMDELKWKSMGMSSVTLENHRNAEGKICYSIHDTQTAVASSPPRGPGSTTRQAGKYVPTFQQYAPEAFKDMRKAYLGYIKHVGMLEKGPEPQTKSSTFTAIDLIYATSGLPKVPGPRQNINGIETHITQQQIIRTYLTAHYTLASGKTRSVPYSAICSRWEDYIDPIYLPTGIPFMEISRYKGAETHRILSLWRARQEKGEIAFRFEQYSGPEKEPALALYNDAIFDGLMDAVDINPHISQTQLDSRSEEDDDDEEEGEAPWPRQQLAADAIDGSEEESEESGTVDPLTSRVGETERLDEDPGPSDRPLALKATRPRPGRRSLSPTYNDTPRVKQKSRPAARPPKPRRRMIESEDDDGTRTTPQTTRGALSPIMGSSPTLAGSSPPVQKVMRPQPVGRPRAPQRKVLPTPEASQTSTPVPPEGSRTLRSGTKAITNAKEAPAKAAANEGDTEAVGKKIKGKMKEMGNKPKGPKKRVNYQI